MFHRQKKNGVSSRVKSLKDLTRTLGAIQFLAEDKRQALLKKIKALSGLDESRYESLCSHLIDNLVAYCQNLPETTNSYYSQAGGLVDHALNRTEAALSLFRNFMIHSQPDLISEEQKLWQYALYSAAILQGIGTLCVDYQINLFDTNGQLIKPWNPLFESLTNTGTYYDYEFQKEPELDFRRRLNLLMARELMPVNGFSWIASNSQVLAVWLALLNDDHRSAGTLGALLIHADAQAIQRYFNELILKNAASRVGPYGRAGTFNGGSPESLITKEQALGAEFLQWMTKALENGRLIINKAPLFMVPGGMLMCQEIYLMFVREHPEYTSWQAVQNGFISLGVHRRGANGSTLGRFEQGNTQQMHSGVVFSKYALVLPALVTVHQINTGKEESLSATELVHQAQYTNQFTQQNSVPVITGLQSLSATGQWQNIEHEAITLKPGAKRGA